MVDTTTLMPRPGVNIRRVFAPGQGENKLLITLTVILLAIIVFFPTAFVFIGAVAQNPRAPFTTLTWDGLIESYGNAQVWGVVGETLTMAVACAFLATVVGGVLAWIFARTDIPHKGALELVVIAPLFLSSFIAAIAWIELAAPRTGLLNQIADWLGLPSWVHVNVMTLTGLIVIMSLHYVPYGYLLIAGSLKNMDAALEEASQVNGRGTLQTALRITAAATRPAILSSFMFVTVSAAGLFSVPALLTASSRFKPLAVNVYHATSGYPADYPLAASLGTILVLISLGGLYVYQRGLRNAGRFVTVGGGSRNRHSISLGSAKYLVVGAVAVYGLITLALPYFALFLSSFSRSTNLHELSFTTEVFEQVLMRPELALSIQNALVVSAITAVVCVTVGLLTAYTTERVRHKGSGWVNSLAMSPLAVPGIVFATGVFALYLGTPLYGTLFVLIIAEVAAYVPHATRVTGNGLAQISGSLEEASRISGASRIRMMRTILIPLMKPSIFAAIIMVFLFAIREINTAVLLYTPDTIVISVLAFDYSQQASLSGAAVVGLIQTALMLAWIAFAKIVFLPKEKLRATID